MGRAALPLALALLLAGCLSPSLQEEPETPLPDERTDDADLRPVTENFSDVASAAPVSPAVFEYPFEVPKGAVGVNGTLRWSSPTARFTLELLDPSGDVVETGYPPRQGVLVVATVEPPRSGTWTYRVSANVAAQEKFELEAVAELLVPRENLVRETREMRASTFYEVNVIMEANASFRFSFNATEPLEWDIHSHPPGGVKQWETGTGKTGDAFFTAPERGIYSVLFENPGPLTSRLSLEMVGEFRIHSHAG